ncbi:MAG: protein kinase domain-containing protein [Gemmatimonadaceae bacterium]
MAELRDQLQATLGDNYVLEQELGGGGMSRVFVAHESSLGRKVVVKVLPPEMAAAVSLDRFRREIQLAAQLQHPHIVPLLAAGETDGLPYFTMPLVRGESLRARLAKGGELPISETIRFLREVASALAYAHENNIVHRDIKPENVLVSGGSAVVTDFGVAKALSASSGAAGLSLTSMGVALGTPAYMAPEQATADPNTDHRADIYALGVMAYEMLTGSTPFQGRSPQATLAAHVTEKPDAITNRRSSVPPALASLVMACLEKRPADRPQTAAEVMHQLDALHTPSGGLTPTAQTPAARRRPDLARFKWIAAGIAAVAIIVVAGLVIGNSASRNGASAEAPVIAVIPFENFGKPEGKEFTDGITEEITSRLSSLSGLKVIGRQTSKGYAGTTKTPQQIASELGVNYLLTGTVRWDRGSDGREIVRVSPALVRTADATQVWSEPYQTVMSGIFEVQSKVANEVASALNLALLAPERDALAAKPTENVEAYGFYLRGTELLRNSLRVQDFRAAIEAFEKAVALDPKFALAYAQLSVGHSEMFWFQGDRSAERVELAKTAADRSLELHPSLAAGHFALGVYHYHAKLDYDEALKELAIAEKLRPNDFETLFFQAAIQRRQGKWRESIANMTRAIELEPRIGLYIADFAATHLTLREYDEAERLADRALIVSPGQDIALFVKTGIAIARDGDIEKGVRFTRQRFDAERHPGVAAATVLGASWIAARDPVMRKAMQDVKWSSDIGDRQLFFNSKMFFHLTEESLDQARAYADSILAEPRGAAGDFQDADYFAFRANAEAVRGNRREAKAAADRAVTLRPASRDAYGGPDILLARMTALIISGDHDAALPQIEELLRIPSPLSRNSLRLHPLFDPLRDNPRFKRLVEGPG